MNAPDQVTTPTQIVEPVLWNVLHPFDRPGWQPAFIALGLFAAILVLALLHIYISGNLLLILSHTPEAIPLQGDFIIVAILSAGFCYLAAVLLYQHRLYTQVLNGLYPAVDMTATDYAAVVRTHAAPRSNAMLVGALAGVALSFVWLLFDPRVYQGDHNPWNFYELSVLGPWQRLMGGLMGGAIGAFMNATLHSAIFLSRLGTHLKPLDLFDLSPLRPFARQGIANVLWLTGFTTIFATSYFLSPEVFLHMIIAFVILNAVLSIGGLMIPVIGMARRIQQRKEIELEGIQNALKELGPARGLAQSGHLPQSAQLLAYRSFVQSVPIFPYNVTTFVRIGLFLLIPLWSWVASSMVDRGVGSFFGWE